MSVKSMLTGKAEKDIQFQNIIKTIIDPRPPFVTASGKQAFSAEYEELAPYSLSNPYFSTIVGMGFDYLARFIVAKNLRNTDEKMFAYRNLAAEHGLKSVERMVEKKIYPTLVKKYETGIEVCKQFINNEKSNFDEMLYFSGYLASLEVVQRSGRPPLDVNKSLIDDTNIEIINDLRTLCIVFEERFIYSGILNENDDVIFNPTFGPIVSLCCGGADADIFINNTLYDFKCTKSRGYKWTECAQLVGYYLLHILEFRCGGNGLGFDEFGGEDIIEKLAFYRGRHGEIEYFEVNSLDKKKVEQGIKELGKMWKLKL